jgi:hypothetical protein
VAKYKRKRRARGLARRTRPACVATAATGWSAQPDRMGPGPRADWIVRSGRLWAGGPQPGEARAVVAGPPGSVTRTLNSGDSTIDTQAGAQHDFAMRLNGVPDAHSRDRLAGHASDLPQIRGLLLVYLIAIAVFTLHTALLTTGSVVVYAHSVATGSHPHVSLSFLVFYVITNIALILYVVYLFILMSRRRRSAIPNNIIFNIMAVVFLLSWHVMGEKSNIGTIIDSAPNLVAAGYFLLSRRVRNTFVVAHRQAT